jgi:hypothetical protein
VRDSALIVNGRLVNLRWRFYWTICCLGCVVHMAPDPVRCEESIAQFGVYEAVLQSSGQYANPYSDLKVEATLYRPDGSQCAIPLFWDGGSRWKLRVSPNRPGLWRYDIRCDDKGLGGKTGSFTCTASDRRGSIQPLVEFPHHFQYQNGEPMWFLGDTAWALFTDNAEERHDRAAAEAYLRVRATQGFNVVHAMLLSEAGWGNAGGLPFHDLQKESINPSYWQEVDRRVAYANAQGIVVGLVLAWGDKRRQEPFAWRRFPNPEARKRYARYIAARYAAYDVYFLVSGEWHAEVQTRGSSEAEIKQEFTAIGNALQAADPHGRMIGIHPMTRHGSVREFNDTDWMRFGDYQQNYRDLHARILESRRFAKPVVNSEYGYYLRDRDGDGTPDKDNSTSLNSMRHASWDIVMAGGYLVTGFGTTYFGGNRDPGPFDVAARKNDAWEQQVGSMKKLFTQLDWWKLQPRDDLLSCPVPRGQDGRELGRSVPPATTYWLLADPGKDYLVYARGVSRALTIQLEPGDSDEYRVRLFNPRSGGFQQVTNQRKLKTTRVWTPPTVEDWVLHLESVKPSSQYER